jgi:tetratricopeptide (TPR) repeat protein
MEANLSPAERARVGARRDVSPEAFALYLKGRHFWNQRTSSGFVLARDYYQRAIDADSQFAAAYAGLAAVYSLQGLWSDVPSAVARERVKAAATRAVQLDDSLAEAHSALGVYEHVYAWNSNAAEREQLRAIALDPTLVTARYFYGNLLRVHGRLEEALVQFRTAAELDPLDPVVGEALARTLVLAGRVDEARQYLLGAIELDSMFWFPHTGLGSLHEATGALDASLGEFRRAMELGGPSPRIHVARLLARTGHEQEARRMLGEFQAQAVRTAIHPPEVATILHALGDADGAIVWLEQAYAERHPMLRFISGNPAFVPLETDPRYLDLLRRIGVRR